MPLRQRQRDEGIEQQRQYELVLETIADLRRPDGPIRLSQHDVPDLGLPADKSVPARRAHPHQQRESEGDLNEDRQQNHLN
jgi:hypothetical protein